MMVQMLGVFAEFERATIVERVIAGMERKAARGEWTAGQPPFGYQRDSDHRFLIPDPTEAPIVSEVFARYTQRLEGSAALAAWLTERGYRTKQASRSTPTRCSRCSETAPTSARSTSADSTIPPRTSRSSPCCSSAPRR